ncbi:hypothetical protein ACQKJG_18220 [Priestia megaterium]|uniref:hypothetical protein n=1 Tax=Priestia megaterium TaxID=1404 RepID=UPI003D0416AA
MKTYDGWGESRLRLDDYLQVGDLVDEEMYEHFIGAVPPACMRSSCTQMGEPYDHVNGRATYATLSRTEHGWMYMGHCHRGEIEEA